MLLDLKKLYPVDDAGHLFISPVIHDWSIIAAHGIDTVLDMEGGLDECIPTNPNGCLYVYFPIFDEDLPDLRKLEAIAVNAFRMFGASMYLDPNPRPPAGDLGAFFRGVPGVATSEFYHYFHSDQETPETVPWTGLEATTRAYAKIIDDVNQLPLSDLQRPEEPAPRQ